MIGRLLRHHTACWTILLLPAAGASPRTAAGDGAFFRPVGQAAELVGGAGDGVASPKQEALLATDGQEVTVVLRTYFRRGPDELAWVVPVPAKPDSVDKADDAIFEQLNRETTPRFFLPSNKGGGLGCGCGAANWAGNGIQADPAVTVEEAGTAGIFEYVVLSAKEPKALHQWLNDHRYAVGVGADRVFARYVADGWYWLAMRIRPEEADKPTLAPHPITYTYTDDELVYPLVISQLSADLENEIVLYVVAPQRVACANWANHTVDADRVRVVPDSPSGTNYEKLITTATTEHGGHVFVTEYAQPVARAYGLTDELAGLGTAGRQHDRYLTRLRAVMTPKAMDRDVTLVPVSGWGDVSNSFMLPDNGATTAAAVLVPLAPLGLAACFALTGVGLLRRGGWRRGIGVGCLALAAVASAMV
ncbi:MAG: DUF2330 domain-containing protein [Phycisphaerae bacterium]|nr:DUF2330 domain-containing protein [Phycisphaerae bacterium]